MLGASRDLDASSASVLPGPFLMVHSGRVEGCPGPACLSAPDTRAICVEMEALCRVEIQRDRRADFDVVLAERPHGDPTGFARFNQHVGISAEPFHMGDTAAQRAGIGDTQMLRADTQGLTRRSANRLGGQEIH